MISGEHIEDKSGTDEPGAQMSEAESTDVPPRILDQLGPYLKHPPVEIGCTLSEAAYNRYHELVSDLPKAAGRLDAETPRRMMYIAEAVSTGVRLNATWALSFPAMSLVRDRYEQAVRFSWLLRKDDPLLWKQYAATYYTKWRKLYAAMNPAQRSEFDKVTSPTPGWMTEKTTNDQRKILERYQSISLADMAQQRDRLPPLGNSAVDKETLADLYSSVYVHFSSVTHYDFYAVRFLGIHQNNSGDNVLSVDPYLPAVLVLQNALFDIIQCREATATVSNPEDTQAFDDMRSIWKDTIHRGGLTEEEYEKAIKQRADDE